MTKKIKSLFKDKKKRGIKGKKRSHNKTENKVDNLIPFVNKSATTGKIQTEECERTRIDTLAKELIDSFAKNIKILQQSPAFMNDLFILFAKLSINSLAKVSIRVLSVCSVWIFPDFADLLINGIKLSTLFSVLL